MDDKLITLAVGYTDPRQVTHREVVLSRRLDGAALMALDDNAQGTIPTQRQLLVLAKAITRFGEMQMPTPLTVLLALDRIDVEDLIAGYDEFLNEGMGERKHEFTADSEMRLAMGYSKDGVVYDLVTFSNRATGRDMIAAEKLGYEGLRRECYLIGRQVGKLHSVDGQEIDGPIGLDVFEKLDSSDIVALRLGDLRWRESFRRRGTSVPGNDGDQRVSPGA